MPSYPIPFKSFYHQSDMQVECVFNGDHPVSPIVFPDGVRTERPLSSKSIHQAPGRGVIKKIHIVQVGGTSPGTFGVDIVDMPFGTGVAPDSLNVKFSDPAVTGGRISYTTEEIPYELASEVISERSLFVGITPAGGTGVYVVKIYVDTRS